MGRYRRKARLALIPDPLPLGDWGQQSAITPNHKTQSMNKSEEIQILADCADRLGSDSYCGSWLRDQIPFIESDIRSDIEPGILASASIKDCANRCNQMLREAFDEKERILAQARKEADEMRERTIRFNELQREELKRTLRAILDRIS